MFWLFRFFFEAQDAPVVVHFNHAELQRGLRRRDLDGSNRHVRGRIDVLPQHLRVIHFVDVVAGKDKHILRSLATDRINVLVHGVGRALVPLFRHAHLRR